MNLETYKTSSIIMGILTIIIILAVTYMHKDILKEPKKDSNPNPPYSFSRFQLWLWTLVICPAFSLYWGFHIPHTPSINETALVLLGIASGATITASIITNVKSDANKNQKDLNLIVLLKSDSDSSGFWSDILKDDSGNFSIPRLQNLIFTIIYIFIFIFSFLDSSLMNYPDFDKYAYALMGISSGTYLMGKGINK